LHTILVGHYYYHSADIMKFSILAAGALLAGNALAAVDPIVIKVRDLDEHHRGRAHPN
jgi:hypothetical protein